MSSKTTDWETVALPEILDFREGPGILARDFRESGVPLLRIAGLKKGNPLLAGCNYLDTEAVTKRWGHFRVRVGDVLLSTSASLGEVAVVDETAEGAIPYTGIIRFRPKGERILTELIPYSLTSPMFKAQIEAMGVGSVIRHFGPSHLKRMTLDLPPLEEQKEIAGVLGALDNKIAVNSRIIDSCYGLGDTLMRAQNARSSHTASIGELARAGDLTFGDGYRTKRTEYGLPGLPILRVAEVRDGYVAPKMEDFVREAFRPAMGAKTSRPGDVILTTKGTVGRVAIIPEDSPEFVYSPQLCYFRVKPEGALSASYLFYWFRSGSFWSQARMLKSQTDMADYLSLGDIESLRIEIPPAEGLPASISPISNLAILVAKKHSESRLLARLRDVLLPKLMSGEIRVRDAEKAVEDAA